MKNLKSVCVFAMIIAVLSATSMSSCRGKAATKTIEMIEKAGSKTPKKTVIKTGGAAGAGKYSDDAVRVYNEYDDENNSYNNRRY